MKINSKERKAYERNISLSYIIGSLMWGRFFVPFLALFYIASKVSLEQFAIIMGVFSLSTLLFEIPTGVLADLFGKKNTLLLSRFMFIIEIVLIAFYNGFWVFLIAKVISGIGVSLSSGTNQAFLFDTLKRLKRQNEHKKISGMLSFITYVSMAFVFIVGALLFTIDPKLPAIASLPLILLGFLLTLFLKEPYKPKKRINLRNYLIHLNEGITYFFRHKYLKYLASLTLLVGTAISIMLSLSSVYFEKILIPVGFIGILSFVGAMLSAFSAKKAHKFEEILGEKKSFLFIQVFITLSILLMALIIPYYGIIFFLIIPLTQGFYEVVLGDYVNRHISTSHRATMLSINNMFDNIGIFILFPIIGYLIKFYSLSFSYLTFGIFLVPCFILSFLYYLSLKRSSQ